MDKPKVPDLSFFGNPCLCCPPKGMFAPEVMAGMTPKAPEEMTPAEEAEANEYYAERNEGVLAYRMERGE